MALHTRTAYEIPVSAICWSGWSQPRGGLLMKLPALLQSGVVEHEFDDVEDVEGIDATDADWEPFLVGLQAEAEAEPLAAKLVSPVVFDDTLLWSRPVKVSLVLTDANCTFCRGIMFVPKPKPGWLVNGLGGGLGDNLGVGLGEPNNSEQEGAELLLEGGLGIGVWDVCRFCPFWPLIIVLFDKLVFDLDLCVLFILLLLLLELLLLLLDSQNLETEEVGSFIYRWEFNTKEFDSFDFLKASCCKCSVPFDRWKPNFNRLDFAELVILLVLVVVIGVELIVWQESTLNIVSGLRKVRGNGTGSLMLSRFDTGDDDNGCDGSEEDCDDCDNALRSNELSVLLTKLRRLSVVVVVVCLIRASLSTLLKLIFKQLSLASSAIWSSGPIKSWA